MTCFRFSGPIVAGKFQFSGMCDSGRWTREDHEETEVHGGADYLHPAPGGGRHGGRRGLPQAGISEATYYNWCKKYAGLMPSEMRRRLEEENGKPKKIVADLSLDKAMLQDVIRRKF